MRPPTTPSGGCVSQAVLNAELFLPNLTENIEGVLGFAPGDINYGKSILQNLGNQWGYWIDPREAHLIVGGIQYDICEGDLYSYNMNSFSGY